MPYVLEQKTEHPLFKWLLEQAACGIVLPIFHVVRTCVRVCVSYYTAQLVIRLLFYNLIIVALAISELPFLFISVPNTEFEGS